MNLSPLMRVANYLTISRILMAPVFMALFSGGHFLLALLTFAIASITDYFDGVIARKEGTTSFGKFMDPLADKLLVCAALICFTLFEDGLIPGWIVWIMIAREVTITVLRVVFASVHGNFVSASMLGKYKTASQMTVIILSLFMLTIYERGVRFVVLNQIHDVHGPIYFMVYLPFALTVVSGLEFLFRNRSGLRKLMSIPDSFSDDDSEL